MSVLTSFRTFASIWGTIILSGIALKLPAAKLRRDFGVSSVERSVESLQGIFDPQGSTMYSHRSLTPQQAAGNVLAPGFIRAAPLQVP